MESEKVKEIKKALEQNDDNGIMYEVNGKKRTCKFIHHKDILTLINELESENERLNGKIKDMEFVGVGNCLSCDINEKGYKDMVKRVELEEQNEMLNKSIEKVNFALQQDHEDRERFRARNEELKDRIAELEKENENKTDTITDLLKKQEFYETEKLKQFAERLKEISCEMYLKEQLHWCIDETLKEFIEK